MFCFGEVKGFFGEVEFGVEGVGCGGEVEGGEVGDDGFVFGFWLVIYVMFFLG